MSVCQQEDWDDVKQFNMMFTTHVGSVVDDSSLTYLRPETAQGIFTNYKNIVDSIYPDLPFGVAQQGKAFRNEISPHDFIFRSREFEQMEIEYFVHQIIGKKLLTKCSLLAMTFSPIYSASLRLPFTNIMCLTMSAHTIPLARLI